MLNTLSDVNMDFEKIDPCVRTSSLCEETEDGETDLDLSTGKLVIDLDFQSGEESGSGPENRINSHFPLSVESPGAGAATCGNANAMLKNTNSFHQPSPRETNKRKSLSKEDDKLKLKIKRRKMQTRTTAASHEVVDHNSVSCVAPSENQTIRCEFDQASSSLRNSDTALSEVSSRPLANKKQKSIAQEKVEQKDATTWVRTISTSVEGDCLGPCEPGTHVSLDGIVWNETAGGVLVVNVTWRGKTYVGTLLDCTKYDWAPPRLCDSSATMDTENKGNTGKGRNGKRPMGRITQSASSSDLSAIRKSGNGQKNKQKLPNSSATDSAEEDSNGSGESTDYGSGSKKPIKIGETILAPMSPVLAECPCRNCDKQFDEGLAMKFHQNDSHRTAEPEKTEPLVEVEGSGFGKPGTQDCFIDQSCNETTKLSDAEAESLKQLFQVVGSPNSSGEGSANLPQSGSRVAPKVKAVAAVAPRTATSDLPKLEPSEERAGSTSPAYSDISDDGAPVLEKEVDKDKTTGVELGPKQVSKPDESSPGKLLAESGSGRITPKLDPSYPVDSGCKQETTSSGCESKGTGIQATGSVIPPPQIGLSGFGQMPRMFQFDPSAQQLMAAGFLNPSPGFGLAVNPIPSNLILPSPVPKPSASHKINELADTGSITSQQHSDSAHIRVPSASSVSSSSGTVSSIADCLKTSPSSIRASPPVQRHMHTHHHTHNFPFLQAPFGLITSQQSANLGHVPAGFQAK